ncbi:MAG: hypothetical protein U1E46_17405 [Hyphomicrobiales bacterium]
MAEQTQGDCEKPYPGEKATAEDLLRLAAAYEAAAIKALDVKVRGRPHTRFPSHFLAIHAIELYLNSWLLHSGCEASEVRSLHHCLAERAARADKGGLKLRKRTITNLQEISSRREYVATRYAPDFGRHLPPETRLTATLQDVARKVRASIGCVP